MVATPHVVLTLFGGVTNATLGGTTTADDVLVAIINNAQGYTYSVAGAGATWTQVQANTVTYGVHRQDIWVGINPTVGVPRTVTITPSGSGAYNYARVSLFRRRIPNPVITTSFATGGGSEMGASTGSITPTAVGQVVVGQIHAVSGPPSTNDRVETPAPWERLADHQPATWARDTIGGHYVATSLASVSMGATVTNGSWIGQAVLLDADVVPPPTSYGPPPLRCRAINGNHGGAGTPWTVTIPSTAVVGDLAIVAVTAINLNGAAHATPAGWTVLHTGTATSGFNNLSRLYTKTIASGDIGSTVTFGSSGDKWCVALRVYKDAAIDSTVMGTINSHTGAVPAVSATASVSSGTNLQIICGTGNQTWYNPARTERTSEFQWALQFAQPAYCGIAAIDRLITAAGATGTTSGITENAGGTGMAVVGYTVVLYRTAPMALPVTDDFTRADTTDNGLGTSSPANFTYFDYSPTSGGIWGINNNQAYVAVGNSAGNFSYFDGQDNDISLAVDVPTMPNNGLCGLLFRYDPANHTGLLLSVESGGVIRLKTVAGTDLTPGGLPLFVAGDRLGGIVDGSNLKISKNGTLLATVAITTNPTSTFHGLAMTGGTQVQNNFRADNLNIAVAVSPPPAEVSYLTATGGLNKITLTWDPQDNVTGYHLVRDDGFLADVTGVSYVDEPLGYDVTHSYTIQPYNDGGDGPVSNVATATTDELVPPTNTEITGLSGAMPVQQDAFLEAIVAAVTHARGVAGGVQVGVTVPCTLVQRGLAVVNSTFLALDPSSTHVAFLAGTTVLWTQPLAGPLVAETIALNFGEV